ncbi:MAG: hypothetical protein ACYC3S_06280 [Chloroflexota bacterium]
MRGKAPLGLGARHELIRLERVLAVPGEVIVGRGKRLRPADIVATATIEGRAFALPIPDLVGEGDKEPLVRLTKQLGDEVAEEECLAVRKRFLGRDKPICPSPEAGMLSAVAREKGFVLISPLPTQVELPAGVSGQVTEVIPGLGATILVSGVRAQGVALVGKEVWGPLRAGAQTASGPMLPDKTWKGAVVFGGHADAAVLAGAARFLAAALVVGSVDAEVWWQLRSRTKPGPSVLLVETIGNYPLAAETFATLAEAEGNPTLITQRVGRLGPLSRPELIVSLDGPALGELPAPRLEPGATVRIVAGSEVGTIGTVASLPAAPRRLPGLEACAVAVVTLGAAGRITVPVNNLELMG